MVRKAIPSLLYSVFIVASLFAAWHQPYNNNDLIFYVAAIYDSEGYSQDRTYELTYSTLAQELPESYKQLRGSSPYLENMDAAALSEQLPWYTTKLGYIWMLRSLYRLGADPVLATRIVSLFFSLVLACSIYLWTSRYLSSWKASFTAILICQLIGLHHIAALSSPDAAASTLLFIGLMFLLVRRSLWISMLFCTASILVRGDNLLLLLGICMLLVYSSHISRNEKYGLTSLCTVLIAMELLIQQWAGYYSWQVHFYHSFIEPLHYPSQAEVWITLQEYLWQFVSGMLIGPYENTISAIVLLCAAVLILQPQAFRDLTPIEKYVLAGLAVGTMGKYLFYPLLELRLFTAQYSLALLLLVKVIAAHSQWFANAPHVSRKLVPNRL